MSNIKLEDLEINNYMIYQDKDSFNFGMDAVLLANFALRESGCRTCVTIPYDEGSTGTCYSERVFKVCDFCAGALPVPLIMYAKRKVFFRDIVKFTAFEIDKEQVELCKKSIEYNKSNVSDAKNIDKDIDVINDDIKNIFKDREKYKSMYETFDMITCNPPYIKVGGGITSSNGKKISARHEVLITFEEICKSASLILKANKKFYVIHHSERFTEISETLKLYSFEVKKVQFIHPNINAQSTLCLIEAVKNARAGVRVMEPIIVFDDGGRYSEKVLRFYGK